MAYHKVGLDLQEEALPPARRELGAMPKVHNAASGMVVTPASLEAHHTTVAFDLDTGYRARWPAHLPRDPAQRDPEQLGAWSEKSGVDLVCVPHTATDGTETFVLQALGMEVKEISPRDLRNLDRLIAAGTLPGGRPVEELLMHFDPNTESYVPEASAALLYITREGNWGVIQITDQVTEARDITGMMGAPRGVGFHRGCNLI